MALSDDFGGDTQLMVAFNGEDEFLGLLADSPAGLFGRADEHWVTVSPENRYFIGAVTYDVEDDFLEFFDKLDAKGIEPTLKQAMAYADKDEEEE